MINNDEKGAALLRIVEVIGQDDLDRIDDDTMYFIIATLNQLNIDRYSTKRNNVYPKSKRGSSYLSPYIRHGLLSLKDVWNGIDTFEYIDIGK